MTTSSSEFVPKPLSDAEHEFLNYIEQEYLVHGGIPTAQVCVERSIATQQFYTRCFKKADFRHALAVRGIALRGLDGPDAGRLSLEQLTVANAMLDLRDNRSQKKKLTEYGIATGKWEAWLRDPVFQNYLRTRSEALLGDSLHESHLALVDRVRSGDLGAIKYFNEITGRYVPNATEKADVASIIGLVVEVIQRHVQDQATLKLLADDIMLIAGGVSAVSHAQTSNARPVGYTPAGKEIANAHTRVIDL